MNFWIFSYFRKYKKESRKNIIENSILIKKMNFSCFSWMRSFQLFHFSTKYSKSTMDVIERLKSVNHHEIPLFSFLGKTMYARVVDVYDGDTLTVIFEYNGEIIKYKMRAMGYDCAEMKPKKNDPNREKEKELAKLARSRFIELMGGEDTIVQIQFLEFDKYGRILGYIYPKDADIKNSISINQIMINEGHGKAYSGGTKEEW